MAELKLGWFSSGDRDSRLLFETVQGKIKRHELNARIEFVFCSKDPSEDKEADDFFRAVGVHHIFLPYLSSRDFVGTRSDYDQQAMARLRGFSPDICILAGYKRIVGLEMCQKLRMLNLHPALPEGPVGKWQDVIKQLIKQRAKESGVMIHLVTSELDRGPVVTFCRFPIKGKDFNKIREQGFAREGPLIIATIKAISRGGQIPDNLDLTQEVEFRLILRG